MAFLLKPIYDLYDKTFVIPSYQRGYRWDADQVEDLLNDLRDFIDSGSGEDTFYCLQPVVVKPLGQTAEGERCKYQLIDGQQRLTTIFLLLHHLFENRNKTWYDIEIDKREMQETFLHDALFAKRDDRTYLENIDTYYLRRAYDVIIRWFDNEEDANGDYELKGKFRALFTQGKTIRPCVSVIWYELVSDDVIDAFERLNYRRIKLTGTELVKAMLLAGSGKNEYSHSRAHSWDRMEKSLQEPHFWSMLNTGNVSEPLNHIEIILDIVADTLNTRISRRRSRERDGAMFNYYVISSYFKTVQDGKSEVWTMIEDTFNELRNWYEKPEWYNYIGLWQRLSRSGADVNEIKKMEGLATGKSDFTDRLRRKVSSFIRDLREEDETDRHPLDAGNLNYENNPDAIRDFLLAFNVMTAAENGRVRFPFHLYDRFNVTSLEHIHPQNIESSMSPADICKWTLKRLADIDEMSKETSYAGKTLLSAEERNMLSRVFESKEWCEKKHLDETDAQWSEIRPVIAKIDAIFGDMAEISHDELHSIKNMALTDVSTNAVLSNHYLDAKRKKLIDLAAGGETYLMPATERVFSKHYTVMAGNPPGDMRLWRKEDRRDYLEALKSVYDQLKS